MANKKISDLTAASALDGNEFIELLQGGASVKGELDGVIKTYLDTLYQAKRSAKSAWVNFNGTGTVAINASSSNVSSITDNGAGDYTVNFSPAFADANYAACVTVKGDGGAPEGIDITSQTSSAFRFVTRAVDGSLVDCSIVNVIVFGN